MTPGHGGGCMVEGMRAIGGEFEAERFGGVGCEEEGAPMGRVFECMWEVTVLGQFRDVVIGDLLQQLLLKGVQTGEGVGWEQDRFISSILEIHSHQIILRHSSNFCGFFTERHHPRKDSEKSFSAKTY